jgi:hypothetical protein
MSNVPHDAGNPLSAFCPMTTVAPAPSNSGRNAWLAAVLLTVVIAGLHGWLWFHAGAFCGDEVNSLNLAGTHSLSYMTRDSFPVLLPLLIGGWTALGLAGNDLNLRLLGLLIGLGLVGALWLSAWSARRTAPWLGLILFGLNGTAIFWTDYLRAYGLGSALLIFTVAAMCRLLEKPSWPRASVLALAAGLSVQALYQNAVFFAAIGLGGWLICWRRNDLAAALKIFAVALAAAVSLLPYFGSVMRWQQATTIRPGFSWPAALDNLHTVLAFPLPQSAWLWFLLALVVCGLAVAALFRLTPSTGRPVARLTPPELQLFAAVILIASLAGYYLFLRHAALITSPWYFIPLLAIVAVCFDLAVDLAKLPRWLRPVAGGILIGTGALSVPFAVRDLACRFSNMDLVAARLQREVSPRDYVVVTPWHLGISFNHYYRGAAAWDTLPPVTDHATYRFDQLPASPAEYSRALQPVLDRIANTLQTGHRVWVVGWMRVPAPHRTAASEEARFLAAHSQSFEAVDLKIKGQTSDYEDVGLLEAAGWQATP